MNIRRLLLQVFRSLPLSTWLAVLAFSIFLWLLVFGHHGLYELEYLLRTKKDLISQKEMLQNEKKDLNVEIQNLDNPLYLKHLIHKEMGFTEPDEVIVQLPRHP